MEQSKREQSGSLREIFQEQAKLIELLCNEAVFKQKYSFTLKQYIQERNKVSKKTLDIADRLQEMIKNTGIAKIVGGGAGILSGSLTIAGILLAPVSGGLSLGLTAVGVGTGIGSAATSLISEGIRNSNIKDYLSEHQSECQRIQKLDIDFIDLKKALCKNIEEMNSYIKNHSKEKQQLFYFFLEIIQQNETYSTLVAQNYMDLLVQNFPEMASNGTVNFKKFKKILTKIEMVKNNNEGALAGKVVTTGAYAGLAVGNKIVNSGAIVAESVETISQISTASVSTAASLTESGAIGAAATVGKNVGKSAFATASKILGPALALVGVGFGIYEVIKGSQDVQSSQIADNIRKSAKQFDLATSEHEKFIKGILHNFRSANEILVDRVKKNKKDFQIKRLQLIPFSVTSLLKMIPSPIKLCIPMKVQLKQKGALLKLIQQFVRAGLTDYHIGFILHPEMNEGQLKDILSQLKKMAKNHVTNINLITRRSIQLNEVYFKLLQMLHDLGKDFEHLKTTIIKELKERGVFIKDPKEIVVSSQTVQQNKGKNLTAESIIRLMQICSSLSVPSPTEEGNPQVNEEGNPQVNETTNLFSLTQEEVIQLQNKIRYAKNEGLRQHIIEIGQNQFQNQQSLLKNGVGYYSINFGSSIKESLSMISTQDLFTLLNKYIHYNHEELRIQVQGKKIDQILQSFSGKICWNPANIVFGPPLKPRKSDFAKRIDEKILATKSKEFQKWFQKMRTAFNTKKHEQLRTIQLRTPKFNGAPWKIDPKVRLLVGND